MTGSCRQAKRSRVGVATREGKLSPGRQNMRQLLHRQRVNGGLARCKLGCKNMPMRELVILGGRQ